MNDPNDVEATMPPDPLASTIPSPPPDFHVDVAPYDATVRPAWFFSDNWDGFASEALDDE